MRLLLAGREENRYGEKIKAADEKMCAAGFVPRIFAG